MSIEEEDGISHLERKFSAFKKTSKDKQTPKVKTCNCKDWSRIFLGCLDKEQSKEAL